MSAPRPAPTRDALAALTTAAGLTLSDAALDALVRPSAAVYAAVDSLDLLGTSRRPSPPRRSPCRQRCPIPGSRVNGARFARHTSTTTGARGGGV